jgi:hypothetical protein
MAKMGRRNTYKMLAWKQFGKPRRWEDDINPVQPPFHNTVQSHDSYISYKSVAGIL